jgi:hypothetical protein
MRTQIEPRVLGWTGPLILNQGDPLPQWGCHQQVVPVVSPGTQAVDARIEALHLGASRSTGSSASKQQ